MPRVTGNGRILKYRGARKMKKVFIFILTVISLCFMLVACNKESALEKATKYIENGQYEDAYAVLYAVENRNAEEEILFSRFSFVLVKTEKVSASGYTSIDDYDLKGNHIKTERKGPDGSVSTTEHRYDGMGRILSSVSSSTSGYYQNGEYIYSSDGKECVLEVEDSYGVDKWYYTYDDNGRKIYEIELKNTDFYPWYRTYSYDDNGNQVKMVLTCNKDRWEYIDTYDVNGNLQKSVVYYNGKLNLESKYTYDTNGNRTSYTSNSGSKYQYSYDDNGNLVTEIYTSSSGKVSKSNYSYTYDDYGNILKEIETAEDTGKSDVTNYTYQLIYKEN